MSRAIPSLTASAALATTLVAACSTPLTGVTGGSCFSAGTSECQCTLQSGNTLTGPACSSTTVTNGVCCADLGWPAAGLTCSCGTYACRQTATDGSCSCDTVNTVNPGPASTCSPKPGFACCQHIHSSCECGPTVSCDTALGDLVEPSCTRASAGCPSSSQAVTAACH